MSETTKERSTPQDGATIETDFLEQVASAFAEKSLEYVFDEDERARILSFWRDRIRTEGIRVGITSAHPDYDYDSCTRRIGRLTVILGDARHQIARYASGLHAFKEDDL